MSNKINSLYLELINLIKQSIKSKRKDLFLHNPYFDSRKGHNLTYKNANAVGRQWVRQYTLALCKELLGHVRSKFSTVPIPSGDLTLNGTDLIGQGREDQGRLRDQLVELLDSLTYSKLLEGQATDAENIMRALKMIPMPLGGAIKMG